MASSTIPYIGSKISLISNSNIRYEGILYTINTQESTIALQSVRSFGTEGRKVPEIPPSSEIYDFIIFRGQDIKDLTVLEGGSGGPGASPHLNDPAIMSMKRPPSDGDKGGGKGPMQKSAPSPSYDSWGQPKGGKPSYDGWGKGADKGWGKPSDKGYGKSMDKGYSDGYSSGKGYDKGYGKGYEEKGKGDKGKGKGSGKDMDKGYGKGSAKGALETGKGKTAGKGASADVGKGKKGALEPVKGKTAKGEMKGTGKTDAKGKGKIEVKGKASGKGDGKASAKGAEKGKSSKGKGGGKRGAAEGSSIGELLPEENEQVKKEYAIEFDVETANEKFDKAAIAAETDEGATLKPLTGYDKTKSFFDSISCEATERSGAADRPKADVAKMRSMDRETFGDARRPPRQGGRGGKGKGYRS